MKYLVIYLAVAGILNPATIFHKDMIDGKEGFWACVQESLMMNLFGFIIVPVLTLVYHFSRKQPKVQLETLQPSETSITDEDFTVAKGGFSYIANYTNDTLH